eukprot:2001230-Rhodomonas_salina.1
MATDRPRAAAAVHAAPSRALCVRIALSRFYCRYFAFACCKRRPPASCAAHATVVLAAAISCSLGGCRCCS